MSKGTIYLITNKTNGKKYVGQTSRDMWIRFEEHCYETRGHSLLHEAIQTEGRNNFSLECLEQVDLEQLDEREKYWIQYYNTCVDGYNLMHGGKGICNFPIVHVIERDLYIESREFLCRKFAELTTWSISFIKQRLKDALKDNTKTFFGYHCELINFNEHYLTCEDEIEEWIKTLTKVFSGKHIECPELNMEFDTIGEAANYLWTNGFYIGTSKMPQRTITTIISKMINNQLIETAVFKVPLTFQIVPGKTTKNDNENSSLWQSVKVYCPELDMTFDSQSNAAQYFIDNHLFGDIKLKTAKLRISDVCRGFFTDYKGYSFQVIND